MTNCRLHSAYEATRTKLAGRIEAEKITKLVIIEIDNQSFKLDVSNGRTDCGENFTCMSYC